VPGDAEGQGPDTGTVRSAPEAAALSSESDEELRAAGVRQSRLCRDNGSPTYAAIIDGLVSRLGGDDPAVTLLRDDPRPPVQSALYLRLLGAVHRIALSQPDCPLRRYLPSTGGHVDPQAAVAAFFRVVAADTAAVAAGMQADVQTNEVGRSAPLSAAMNYLTVAAGLPLRLLEVGAAAGLNLWMDRYFVQAGAAGWGPTDSPVRLTGHFTSGKPPATAMTVVDRRGCDLNPLHPTGSRLLLESFIWPEHVGRLRLLRAAVSVAAPVPVERSSAGTWIRQQLATLPAGVTTVVFHSIVWPYLSGDERTALDDAVRAAGARADQDHRLGWVSLEPDRSGVCLTCERWPENERLVLATSSPHGTNVVWQPAPSPAGSLSRPR
jgi:hypothetical protein